MADINDKKIKLLSKVDKLNIELKFKKWLYKNFCYDNIIRSLLSEIRALKTSNDNHLELINIIDNVHYIASINVCDKCAKDKNNIKIWQRWNDKQITCKKCQDLLGKVILLNNMISYDDNVLNIIKNYIGIK